MKKIIVIISLTSLLFSSSSFACGCIMNKATRYLASLAIPFELASAGLAYWAKDKVTPTDEKDIYMAQAIAYGISGTTLLLAKWFASDGALAPSFASIAMIATAVGIGSNLGGHSKVNITDDVSKYVTEFAFYTGLIGSMAHGASMFFLLMKKCCTSEPRQDYGPLNAI
ncbi:MAG: hypothetical protein WCK42_09440 [Myxococcaceae bacterium]